MVPRSIARPIYEEALVNEVTAYIIALAGFGTANGLEVVSSRQYEPIIGAPNRAASVIGCVLDVALMIYAFVRFNFGTAIGVVVAGGICTVIFSTSLPRSYRPGLILLAFAVGLVATVLSFV
jgi:hypothetical protein